MSPPLSTDLLTEILAGNRSVYALLCRADPATGARTVTALSGQLRQHELIEEISTTADVFVLLPYRQIRERGYPAHDDGAPLLAIYIDEQQDYPLTSVLDKLPRRSFALTDGHFDGTEHEIDLLVLATGFDAVDGGYKKMHLTGRDGTPISELWNETTAAYLGIATHQFPNMFMVYGPNSVFTNLPPGIETQIEWITELIRQAETRGSAVVEVSETAVRAWAQLCDDIANASLFPKAHSWIFGANIPGKTSRALFYFAGLGNYRRVLADEADAGYPNFTFHSDDHTSLEREHASIPQ